MFFPLCSSRLISVVCLIAIVAARRQSFRKFFFGSHLSPHRKHFPFECISTFRLPTFLLFVILITQSTLFAVSFSTLFMNLDLNTVAPLLQGVMSGFFFFPFFTVLQKTIESFICYQNERFVCLFTNSTQCIHNSHILNGKHVN